MLFAICTIFRQNLHIHTEDTAQFILIYLFCSFFLNASIKEMQKEKSAQAHIDNSLNSHQAGSNDGVGSDQHSISIASGFTSKVFKDPQFSTAYNLT